MLHNLAFYSSVARTWDPVRVPDMLHRRRGFRFIDHDGQVNYAAKDGSVAYYGGQVFERSLFLAFGGFDGHLRVGADTDFNWRLLRFHRVGNLPRVLYSRRHHEDSLTQHPDTNHASALRKKCKLQREAYHERIRRVLSEGDLAQVRALCTSDLYHGDVEVEEVHTGFDFHPDN